MVGLMVDSGELHVKLELTNLYQSIDVESSLGNAIKEEATPPVTTELTNEAATIKPLSVKVTSANSLGSNEIKMIEIVDSVTKKKTVIIDKATLPKKRAISNSIPNVRLIATPVQVTSNSNLFSEVVIKFKTI
jgi:hypothetical protein